MAYTWQYYDLVLGGMFLSMFLGVLLGVLTSLSMPLAIVGSGLVAVVFMGHGLFVNGPVDAPSDLTEPVEALN
ncbi:MAG: hypothetical protein ACQETI_05785 [Halobacteriota archaeon]